MELGEDLEALRRGGPSFWTRPATRRIFLCRPVGCSAGLHPGGDDLGDVEGREPAIGLQEDAHPRSPVGHRREVVPGQRHLVVAGGCEPSKCVGDVIEPRSLMQKVPVDQTYGFVPMPHHVPRTDIAVTPHRLRFGFHTRPRALLDV